MSAVVSSFQISEMEDLRVSCRGRGGNTVTSTILGGSATWPRRDMGLRAKRGLPLLVLPGQPAALFAGPIDHRDPRQSERSAVGE
jgi:hypothetical protein